MGVTDDDKKQTLNKQAWDYFELHAGQRLTIFNFYIVVSGVVTAALVTCFEKESKLVLIGLPLGLLLVFFSFVFRKLDRRNAYLIKNSEAALRLMETEGVSVPDDLKIFVKEEGSIDKTVHWLRRSYSYSSCFLFVFWAFGLIGGLGAVLSVILFFYPRDSSAPAAINLPSGGSITYSAPR